MKSTAVAIVLLVLASAASADSIVLKNGKRIEWRALRDKGDSYDVETPDGLAQVVAKKDIERLEVTEVKPALTGASISFEGKTRAIDLLSGIVPKRDTVFGAVKYVGSALSVASEIDAPTILKIPVKLPGEYDLSIVVDRRSAIGNFYVGLVGATESAFVVEFDGSNGSMSSIAGGPSQRGSILDKGTAHTILIQVRKDVVNVTVDKKDCLLYRGSSAALSVPDLYKTKGEPGLFIGTQRIYGNAEHANFHIQRMTLITKP